MRAILAHAIREAVLILILGITVALVFNFARKDGIALVAEPDAFRIVTDAEFMKPEDAHRLFEEGNVFLIDAREPELFSREHIEGAINVPATSGEVTSIAWLVPAGPNIICYASEQTQRQAGVLADKLLEFGFAKVYVLYGGIEAWKDLGLPMER